MMRQTITCPHCGSEIREHYQLFAHEPRCEVQAAFAAKHQRLTYAIADRKFAGTGIVVRRGDG
jgi:hypothetical protein